MKVELTHEMAVMGDGSSALPSLKIDDSAGLLAQSISINLDAESMVPEVLLRFIPTKLKVRLAHALASSDLGELGDNLGGVACLLQRAGKHLERPGSAKLALACQRLADLIVSNGELPSSPTAAERWARQPGIVVLRLATLQSGDSREQLVWDVVLRADGAGQHNVSFVGPSGRLPICMAGPFLLTLTDGSWLQAKDYTFSEVMQSPTTSRYNVAVSSFLFGLDEVAPVE